MKTNFGKTVAIVGSLALAIPALSACSEAAQDEAAMETEEAMDETGAMVDDAADATGDAMDEAAAETGEAMDATGDAMAEGAAETEEAMEDAAN